MQKTVPPDQEALLLLVDTESVVVEMFLHDYFDKNMPECQY